MTPHSLERHQLNITKRKRLVAAIALSAALVGTMAGCAGEPTSTPETAVTKYFGYLADKDLNSAIEASSAEMLEHASKYAVIPKDALEKVEPIKDFKVENVEAGTGTVIANVSYRIGDEKIESPVHLVDNGTDDKPLWLIDQPLPAIAPDRVADAVTTISGQTVTGDVVFTIPGVYDVTVSSAGGYFEDLVEKVSVRLGDVVGLSSIFPEDTRKYTTKWNEAIAAAWAEYEPDVHLYPDDESQADGSYIPRAAQRDDVENMVRRVKSPSIGETSFDDVNTEWTVKLVDGEWERYTSVTTKDAYGSYVNTFGFENQGNVVESFSFRFDAGEIYVNEAQFAHDPNEEYSW
jgi:hypothetical protein